MSNEHPQESFTAQRVVNRITENPQMSHYLLGLIRDNPEVTTDTGNDNVELIYGEEGSDFLNFLIKIVGDSEVYQTIDLDDEVYEAANKERLAKIGHLSLLESQNPDMVAKYKRNEAISNRANELLALANLAIKTMAQTDNSQTLNEA